MKSIFIFLLIALLFGVTSAIGNTQVIDTTKVYGVTTDAINGINYQVQALQNLHYKPTTRVVFDEWQPASGYFDAVKRIHKVSFVMGEILDSYYMSQYSLSEYASRTSEYLAALGDLVDIWEIGNEVNGEWCGPIADVNSKISAALNLCYFANKKTALTLYYNKDCWSNPNNEMFHWVNSYLPYKIKFYIDYVFVSYYEDDCNGLQPNWQQVFDSLHVIFPRAKLGIGECGTTNSAMKETYMNRYYRMNVTTPNYVGGYFWWYFRQDCVPYTKPLWTVINNAMMGTTGIAGLDKPKISSMNYPNPFNPSTKISFYLPDGSYTSIKVYDITGREVETLADGQLSAGLHDVTWNASKYSSGIYIYRIESGSLRETKKMLLVK